jgi:hypothetical protein
MIICCEKCHFVPFCSPHFSLLIAPQLLCSCETKTAHADRDEELESFTRKSTRKFFSSHRLKQNKIENQLNELTDEKFQHNSAYSMQTQVNGDSTFQSGSLLQSVLKCLSMPGKICNQFD